MSDPTDMRKIMAAAKHEARAMGSSRVEAEHLLLALAASSNLAAGQLLSAHGLNHAAVREALTLEFAHSLQAVGIRVDDFSLPAEGLPLTVDFRLTSSTKLALQRAMKARTGRGRGRRLESLHLLLGLLSANVGTVPRALEAAGVDREALTAAARATPDRAA